MDFEKQFKKCIYRRFSVSESPVSIVSAACLGVVLIEYKKGKDKEADEVDLIITCN